MAPLQGTFSVGHIVTGITFDGRNIWVGALDGTVWKLRASDGALPGIF
jgi:hypothetical protein